MRLNRTGWVILGGVAVVVVAALIALLVFRDTSTPIEAADLASGDSGRELGDSGIYTYATDGFSAVDVLAGARKAYPAETPVLFEDAGCGWVIRWQPLEERTAEWVWCDGRLESVTSHLVWFGIPTTETTHCEGGEDYAVTPRGSSWAFTCTRDGYVGQFTAETLGAEKVLVGGEALDAIHLRLTETISGDTVGVSVTDFWFHLEVPLPLRLALETQTRSASPLGDVNFEESVMLELAEARPLG